MEGSPWLRLITIGLVLAALAVGYFLISGRFAQEKKQVEGVTQSSPQATTEPLQPSPNAYTRIVDRNKSGAQTLPNTGSPMLLIGVFSLSAIISGWSLRKFPQ
ncbi:hypothetical protein HYZ06_01940 [Candidatus Daviesbacteria bacterium]|nr:hypothetical protein [Candidatus Daviesbacteria bacterium]